MGGCGAGGGRRRPSECRWRAWPIAPAARSVHRRGCRLRRSDGSVRCASGPAGVRDGWPVSPGSRARPRRCIGCSSAPVSRRPRPERPAVVRYLWPCPGQLLHMDTKKLGRFEQPGHAVTGDRRQRSRRVGWEYVHSIIDDCSRLAYSEIHDDETAVTVTAFTERALDVFLDHGIVAERLMTDNAFAYTHNRSLRELLRRRAIRHLRTRPYTPRTNGKVERYQQTLQREWAYALEYASSDARRQSLPHWVRHYNERRTHSALGDRPPIQRVREVTGLDS